MRRALLVVLLLALAAPSSSSAALTDLQIADAAWPGHPCTGKVQIVMDPAVGLRGHAGEATGRVIAADGSTLPCVVSIDPQQWATMSPYDRCRVIVHEVGHLAGHQHAEGGVMSFPAGDYTPCHAVERPKRSGAASPLRDQIVAALSIVHPTARVSCGRWRRGKLRCKAVTRHRVIRYVATRRGNDFTIW